ncbi:MAG TPA: beta-ketoacyl synthase N-terminal-like domain-containing protein [Pseudonocardiaceae bacterium]|jgi:acyl transferase domain-containing protein
MTTRLAVVGIDCQFPGAVNKDAFWDLLVRGEHGLSAVPRQRWDADRFYSAGKQAGTTNTRTAGFISDPDAFDHVFFGISPREAAAMDPQQRLLLQTSWRALEDAGMAPTSVAGTSTGVYVGIMSSEWANLHMTDYAGVTAHRGSGNGYCMTANRISYHLDLKGPSLAIDTACSSSLVALHSACAALRAGDCDQALVGGVNLLLTPALSIFYHQAGLSAPDGRCKPFSAGANGIGRGEGVGVVVLRRLADALADRQPVYAVIEASAVNSDGRSNGLTAPSRWSQRQVVADAYQRAGLEPDQVRFVEGHGTGTTLGDMIEVRALGDVHGADRTQPCLLGSVKGNIGHAEGAAGIAGLIKACLAMDRRILPPTICAAGENPELRLAEHGLRLAARPSRLPKGTVFGGVSSFGLGGTNAHVVLSTPPVRREPVPPQPGGVLTISANTVTALHRNVAMLAATVTREPAERLAQLCHSTNVVKSTQRCRLAVPLSTPDALRDTVLALADDPGMVAAASRRPAGKPKIAFLFTGQGSQYAGMAAALYANCPAYQERFDEADAVLTPLLGRSIGELVAGTVSIDDTALTQPALFCVQYAMAAALADLGVVPDTVVGHSIGEYAAACAAGRLTLAEAAAMVVARGALMQGLPPGGSMVAVRCSVAAVQPLVDDEPSVSVAAVNGPASVVLSGAADAVARITAALAETGIQATPLTVSHAFHSPLMAPMLEPFGAAIGTVPQRSLTATFVSTVHGRVVGPAELDTDYWVQQVRAPVRFADALGVLAERAPTHLVEIGPRPVLLALARRAGFGSGVATLACCPGKRATGAELSELLAVLYRDGLAVNWTALYRPGQRVLRRLPPYVFSDDARFWASAATVDTGPTTAIRTAVRAPVPIEPQRPTDVGSRVLAAIAEVGDYSVDDLHTGTRLRDDLGYDSIMVMQLGDRLTDLLSDDEPLSVQELLPQIVTVGDLMSFVADRCQDGATAAHRSAKGAP